VLDPSWRVPALVRHAAVLDVDILCLQEVETATFTALQEGLASAGYTGIDARKGRNRPDGCAIFLQTARFALLESRRVAYADGAGALDSGHIAQLAILSDEGKRLAVLNTHLKWDPPGIARERQWAYRQILQAIETLRLAGPFDGQIVCGDFNVTPESDVVEALRAAGMDYAHHGAARIATCNSNREARLIDYLFHSRSLRAHPVLPSTVDGQTLLPSYEQPSDHVPLLAEFEWVQ